MMAVADPAQTPQINSASLLDAESLPFALAILRAKDGTVEFVNNLMTVLLRSSLDKIKGKKIPGLYDDNQERSEIFKLLKKSTFVPPKKITIKNSENKSLTISASSSLIKFQHQLCILVAFYAPQADAENVKRLRIAIERHNMALQAAKIGIWSWDLMSNRVAWDENMHNLFGIEQGVFSW